MCKQSGMEVLTKLQKWECEGECKPRGAEPEEVLKMQKGKARRKQYREANCVEMSRKGGNLLQRR